MSEWGESGDSEVVVVVVVVVQDGRVASRISRRRECVSVNTVLATEAGQEMRTSKDSRLHQTSTPVAAGCRGQRTVYQTLSDYQ